MENGEPVYTHTQVTLHQDITIPIWSINHPCKWRVKQTNKQTNTDLRFEMLVSNNSEFYKWQPWKSQVRVLQLRSYSHH